TVVTNSIPVAETLRGSEATVVLTGGIRTPSDALAGPVAVAAIGGLHVDVLFLGVHGMSDRAGFTTPNLMEAETNRARVAAAHRQSRTFLPPSDECPLCPSRPPDRLTEIPAADYDVVVFENRFPSFSHRVEGVDQPALGRCEVVCFTSDHDSAFSRLTPARV